MPAVLALLLLLSTAVPISAAEEVQSGAAFSAGSITNLTDFESRSSEYFTEAVIKIADAEDETKDADSAEAPSSDTVPNDEYYNHVWPEPAEVEAESVLVMENSTSAILYEKDADTMRYPASTTKILTALLAIENCSLDEIVTFSENACTLEPGATSIYAEPGEQMPMKDVLYGLMLPSGNDCANAIAEHVAGSVEAFSEMMNERAAEIGCTSSHFSNPHGLFAEDHYTTARDLALIAQEAFHNSTFVDIISTPLYYAAPTNTDSGKKRFVNTNLLLDEESDYYDPEVIGGKTGYLDEAGRCFVAYGVRDGFNVITVQLKGGYEQIFTDTQTLLNFAFDNFKMDNVAANERRFSYPVEEAKVALDPSAQILALQNIPFDQLESEVVFATDLSVDQKADLQETLQENEDRSLFAVIDYAYAGHHLGSANVWLDPQMELAPAAFTSLYYISPVYLVIFVILVLILAICLFGFKKRKKSAPQPAGGRRRGDSQRYSGNNQGYARRRFDDADYRQYVDYTQGGDDDPEYEGQQYYYRSGKGDRNRKRSKNAGYRNTNKR